MSLCARQTPSPRFVCAGVSRDQEFLDHHVVYEDAAIAFPNRYPTQYGHTLLAPKEHREQVAGDFIGSTSVCSESFSGWLRRCARK